MVTHVPRSYRRQPRRLLTPSAESPLKVSSLPERRQLGALADQPLRNFRFLRLAGPGAPGLASFKSWSMGMCPSKNRHKVVLGWTTLSQPCRGPTRNGLIYVRSFAPWVCQDNSETLSELVLFGSNWKPGMEAPPWDAQRSVNVSLLPTSNKVSEASQSYFVHCLIFQRRTYIMSTPLPPGFSLLLHLTCRKFN